MRFHEAFTKIRRELGIVFPTKDDVAWLCEKMVRENKEVFDGLR